MLPGPLLNTRRQHLPVTADARPTAATVTSADYTLTVWYDAHILQCLYMLLQMENITQTLSEVEQEFILKSSMRTICDQDCSCCGCIHVQ